jgi:GT2 family glycosyltransferase
VVEVSATVAPIVGFQTVLFHTSVDALERTLDALDNAARIGLTDQACGGFVVLFGDATPVRVFSDDDVERLNNRYQHIREIRYHWFGTNVGTSRGHNELAELLPDRDLLILANPDVVVEPRAIWRMLATFDDPAVGLVEGKQLPIEHPKDYQPGTGFTSWGSGAFTMIRKSLFMELGGYDAATFFMYCDDVDLSWRVKEAGHRVVHQPAAAVFHDKYLDLRGKWMPTSAEVRYSAQAALLLAHKWSKPRRVQRILAAYEKSSVPEEREAAAEFLRRKESGELPEPRDPGHRIGVFHRGNYAKHRYSL